jgi:hypothetical protein
LGFPLDYESTGGFLSVVRKLNGSLGRGAGQGTLAAAQEKAGNTGGSLKPRAAGGHTRCVAKNTAVLELATFMPMLRMRGISGVSAGKRKAADTFRLRRLRGVNGRAKEIPPSGDKYEIRSDREGGRAARPRTDRLRPRSSGIEAAVPPRWGAGMPFATLPVAD